MKFADILQGIPASVASHGATCVRHLLQQISQQFGATEKIVIEDVVLHGMEPTTFIPTL